MNSFNHPLTSYCWKQGYEQGARSFHSGVTLTEDSLRKAANDWWLRSAKQAINADATLAAIQDNELAKLGAIPEFAGGFEAAYFDCERAVAR